MKYDMEASSSLGALALELVAHSIVSKQICHLLVCLRAHACSICLCLEGALARHACISRVA
jgi:hypothetical protein